MRLIESLDDLTELGRVRLSDNFFMREMLYSDVGNFYRIPNIPDDPGLAIEAGSKLCQLVLEPLRKRFGQVCVRSAYRSSTLNAYCNERYKAGEKASWCVDNESNHAEHIWDRRDSRGFMGATATVVIPGYLDDYSRTNNWRPLAWWIRDHIEHYAAVFLFRNLCAFNIRWYEGPSDQAIVYLEPPVREVLTQRGLPGFDGAHGAEYAGVLTTARDGRAPVC